jgi:hypothetical protein
MAFSETDRCGNCDMQCDICEERCKTDDPERYNDCKNKCPRDCGKWNEPDRVDDMGDDE